MTLFCRDISQMDKRITFQRKAKVSNAMGGFSSTWTDITTSPVWARILPTSAKETRQSDKETMTVSHTISIRYRRDIRPSWRIRYKNRYFAIVGLVNPQEDNEWWDINVKEVKA